MPGNGTLHFAAIRDDKKSTVHDLAKKVASAAKGRHKFYTYVPIRPGSLAGKAQAAVVFVPEDGAVAGATPLDAGRIESAANSAANSLAGVAKVKSYPAKPIARHVTAGKGPAPYVLAIGVQVKPGQDSAFRDAAKKLIEANKKLSNPVEYSVYKGGAGDDRYLIVLRGDDVSGVNPDGTGTSAAVQAVRATLAGFVKVPLRLVPAASSL